jgi:hypothetical protein
MVVIRKAPNTPDPSKNFEVSAVLEVPPNVCRSVKEVLLHKSRKANNTEKTKEISINWEEVKKALNRVLRNEKKRNLLFNKINLLNKKCKE